MKVYLIGTAMGMFLGLILAMSAVLTTAPSPELVSLGHMGGALMFSSIAAFALGCIVVALD